MSLVALSNSRIRARIDNIDVDAVSEFSWYAKHSRDQDYPCAGKRIGDKVQTIRLHRFIAQRMGILTTENMACEVHHIDNNRFNCRRDNLMVLTAEEHGRVTRGCDIPF
jgi:hypothetical protein